MVAVFLTFELQVDAFEIFCFLESGVVIGGVAGGLEFVAAAAGLAGGKAHGVEKFIGGDMRGTGTGKE